MSEDKAQLAAQMYPEKSFFIAYILWLFLGYIGANYYYVGRWFLGTLKLVLALIGFVFILFGGYAILSFLGTWWMLDIIITYFLVSSYNNKAALNRLGYMLNEQANRP